MIKKLKRILSEYTKDGYNNITRDTDLKSGLGLNSLELAELACAVEDEFDIEIPDSAMRSFVTVGDFIKFIEDNQ